MTTEIVHITPEKEILLESLSGQVMSPETRSKIEIILGRSVSPSELNIRDTGDLAEIRGRFTIYIAAADATIDTAHFSRITLRRNNHIYLAGGSLLVRHLE